MNDSLLCTIDVDGRPTMVLPVSTWNSVKAFGKEDWLRADFSFLFSGGDTLANSRSLLYARPASPTESAAFGSHMDSCDDGQEPLEICYLVPIDEPGR